MLFISFLFFFFQKQIYGPKTIVVHRKDGHGFGFTLRHFIVYPPETCAVSNSRETLFFCFFQVSLSLSFAIYRTATTCVYMCGAFAQTKKQSSRLNTLFDKLFFLFLPAFGLNFFAVNRRSNETKQQSIRQRRTHARTLFRHRPVGFDHMPGRSTQSICTYTKYLFFSHSRIPWIMHECVRSQTRLWSISRLAFISLSRTEREKEWGRERKILLMLNMRVSPLPL